MELIAIYESQKEVVERSAFKSRKVWVKTDANEKYPQQIEIEVQQDKVDMFNAIKPGSEVKLYINLRGREWTKPETGIVSRFNSLVCWKVEVIGATVQQAAQAISQAMPVMEVKSDLPF